MTDTSALPQFVVSAFDGREFSDWANQSRETLLNHFLEWNGIVGYTGQILQALAAIDQFLADNCDTVTPDPLAAYLEAELRRYYPDAQTITVDHEDETFLVSVVLPSYEFDLRCELGSDDDWYTFTENSFDRIITVPLMPES